MWHILQFPLLLFLLVAEKYAKWRREAGATKLVTGEEFDHSHSTGTHSKQN